MNISFQMKRGAFRKIVLDGFSNLRRQEDELASLRAQLQAPVGGPADGIYGKSMEIYGTYGRCDYAEHMKI